MSQPDIIIKEAGKGAAVTLNKNHYRAVIYECFKNLNSLLKL